MLKLDITHDALKFLKKNTVQTISLIISKYKEICIYLDFGISIRPTPPVTCDKSCHLAKII